MRECLVVDSEIASSLRTSQNQFSALLPLLAFQRRGRGEDERNRIGTALVQCGNFDYNLWYDFSTLEKELKSEGLLEIIKSDDNSIYIEMIKFKTVFEFLKDKI